MKEMKKNNKGFSLVELIVVVAIMAVLMAVLIPTLVRNVEKSRLQKDKSAISELREAVVLAMAEEKCAKAQGGQISVNNGALVVDENLIKDEPTLKEVVQTLGGTIPATGKPSHTITLGSKLSEETLTVTLKCDAAKGTCSVKVELATNQSNLDKADYEFEITTGDAAQSTT